MSGKRLAVVTGGASGIGRACARRFARAGDSVVVADIDAERGGRAAREIAETGEEARFVPLDVADEGAVEALARELGAVDVLVNSAGLLQNAGRLETVDWREHDRIWAVNYRGTWACCRAFAPAMRAARKGAIVNVSSTSAARVFPLHAYGPGKAAIDNLTAILAADLGPDGVRVNAVMPGYVRSDQMQARIDAGLRDPSRMEAQSAFGRMVEPEEIADGAYFLCSDAARAITGVSLPIDAGWLARATYVLHPGWPPADRPSPPTGRAKA